MSSLNAVYTTGKYVCDTNKKQRTNEMVIDSYISLVTIESHEVKAGKKRSIITLGK